MRFRTTLLAIAAAASPVLASTSRGFGLEVLVDGAARPEYPARGTVYVEALRGRDFSLRITNPLGVRVAVALSVDGLNSIDARHGTAKDARKWVLGPYESVVIPGWQVSGETSRKFTFTGEKRSYGAQLGQTANLGTIEAVFFREKLPWRYGRRWSGKDKYEEKISSNERGREDAAASADAAGAAPPAAKAEAQPRDHSQKSASSALSDDLAATGMGRRTRFDVTRVDLELEDDPAASVRLRYEFRAQLVALGVLPSRDRDPIARREAGRGFDDFCPQPN